MMGSVRILIYTLLVLILLQKTTEISIAKNSFVYTKSNFNKCTKTKSIGALGLYLNSDPSKNNPNANGYQNFTTMETYTALGEGSSFNEDVMKHVEELIPKGVDQTRQTDKRTIIISKDIYLKFAEYSYIYVTLLSNDAYYDNSLGIFKYSFDDQNFVDASYKVGDIYYFPGQLVFPSTKCVSVGDTVKVGPFNKGEVISFYLISNGWKEAAWKKKIFFSLKRKPMEPYGDEYDHSAWYYWDKYDCTLITYEDQSLGQADYNDVVFAISIEGSATADDLPIGVDDTFTSYRKLESISRDNYFVYNFRRYALHVYNDECGTYLSIPPGWKIANYREAQGLIKSAIMWSIKYPDYCFLFNESVSGDTYKGYKSSGLECDGVIKELSGYYYVGCNKKVIVLDGGVTDVSFKNRLCSDNMIGKSNDEVGENPAFSPISSTLYVLSGRDYCEKNYIEVKVPEVQNVGAEILIILDIGYDSGSYYTTYGSLGYFIHKFGSEYPFLYKRFRYVSSGSRGYNEGTDFVGTLDELEDHFSRNVGYYNKGEKTNIFLHASRIITKTSWSPNTFKLALIITSSENKYVSDEIINSFIESPARIVITVPRRNDIAREVCERIGYQSCYYSLQSLSNMWIGEAGPFSALLDKLFFLKTYSNLHVRSDSSYLSAVLVKDDESKIYDLCYKGSNKIIFSSSKITVQGWGKIMVNLKVHMHPVVNEIFFNIFRNIGDYKAVKIKWNVYHPDEKLMNLVITEMPVNGRISNKEDMSESISLGDKISVLSDVYYLPTLGYPESGNGKDRIVATVDDGCYSVPGATINIDIEYEKALPKISKASYHVKMGSVYSDVDPLSFSDIVSHLDNLEMTVTIKTLPRNGIAYDRSEEIYAGYTVSVKDFIFRFVPNNIHIPTSDTLFYDVSDGTDAVNGLLEISVEEVHFESLLKSEISEIKGEKGWIEFIIKVENFNYNEILTLSLYDAPADNIFRINNNACDRFNSDKCNFTYLSKGDNIKSISLYETNGKADIVLEWNAVTVDDVVLKKDKYTATFSAKGHTGIESKLLLSFYVTDYAIPVALAQDNALKLIRGESIKFSIRGFDYNKVDGYMCFIFKSIPEYGSLFHGYQQINSNDISINVTEYTNQMYQGREVLLFSLELLYKSESKTKMDEFSFLVKNRVESHEIAIKITVEKLLSEPLSADVSLTVTEGDEKEFGITIDNVNELDIYLHILVLNSVYFPGVVFKSNDLDFKSIENGLILGPIDSQKKIVLLKYISFDGFYSANSDNTPNISVPFGEYIFYLEDEAKRSINYTLNVYVEHKNHPPTVSDNFIVVKRYERLIIQTSEYVHDMDVIDKNFKCGYFAKQIDNIELILSSTGEPLFNISRLVPCEESISFVSSVFSQNFDDSIFSPSIEFKYFAVDQGGARSSDGTTSIAVYSAGLQPNTSLTHVSLPQGSVSTIDLLDKNFVETEIPSSETQARIVSLPKIGELFLNEECDKKVEIDSVLNAGELLYYKANDWKFGDKLASFNYILSDKYVKVGLVESNLIINITPVFKSSIVNFEKPLLNISTEGINYIDTISEVTFKIIVRDVNALPEKLELVTEFAQFSTDDWIITDINGSKYHRTVNSVNIMPSKIRSASCPDIETLYALEGKYDDECLVEYEFIFKGLNGVTGRPFISLAFRVLSEKSFTRQYIIHINLMQPNMPPIIIAPSVIDYVSSNVKLATESEVIRIIDDCKIDALTLVFGVVSGSGSFLIKEPDRCEKTGIEEYKCHGNVDGLNLWLEGLVFSNVSGDASLKFTVYDNGCGGTYDDMEKILYNTSAEILLRYIPPTESGKSVSISTIVIGTMASILGVAAFGSSLYVFRRTILSPVESYFVIGSESLGSSPENPLFKPKVVECYNPIFNTAAD